jgi:hypothetical protein
MKEYSWTAEDLSKVIPGCRMGGKGAEAEIMRIWFEPSFNEWDDEILMVTLKTATAEDSFPLSMFSPSKVLPPTMKILSRRLREKKGNRAYVVEDVGVLKVYFGDSSIHFIGKECRLEMSRWLAG